MQYHVGQHEGQLCVVGEWQCDYEKPEKYRHYWPLGRMARDYPDWIGKDARSSGFATFEIYDNGRRIPVRLVDGGQTKAVFIEVQPVKKPRGAVSWRDGKWCKW